MYLGSSARHNWQHPFQPIPHLTSADAAAVAALLGGQKAADAAAVEQLGTILAAGYGGAEAHPDALQAAVRRHGGRVTALALGASYFWAGHAPDDVAAAAAAMATEAAQAGTGRLGTVPEMDGEVVMASATPVTSGPAVEQAEPVPDVPPFQVGGRMFEFDYADDFRGNVSALELTEAEEDYRRRAYEAVVHYARDYGLSLIPVWWMRDKLACACRDGESCRSAGKHPVDLRWPETATSDPEQAARWWRPLEPGEINPVDWRPQANIGAMTGERHFITDVDTDAGKHGKESLARLIAEGGGEEMPATLTYQTGGGGDQYIMLIPEGVEVRSSNGKLADGIDIKGVRGFGILPPSISGKGPYVMTADRSPDVQPPTWEAYWLREQHRQRTEHIRALPAGDQRQIPQDGLTKRAHAYITAALADASAKVALAKDGTRNDTLNHQAFDLFAKFGRAGFLSADDIAAAMSDTAEACGMDDKAINATIRSAAKGGQIKDRTSELPDFLFEVPVQTPMDGLVLPGINSAIYAFEQLYDLRQSGEEFFARPAGTGTPAVVAEIGDAVQRRVMLWWRRAAETWNAAAQQVRDEATEAWKTELEAMDPLVQLEVLKEAYFERRAQEDDEGKRAEVFPAMDRFSRITEHLKASATQHDPVELHLRVVDGPGYVVVDLADETGGVVLITADGWQVCDVREVEGVPWFRRSGAMLPQVIPVAPGDVMATLEAAREVLGVDAAQWGIVLAGMIGAYFPSIARPGWWLSGPSGAGKTTRGEMLAGWVDPVTNLGGRMNLKRDPRDARAKAMNTFVFTIDNASVITQDESDFWCQMHTGASDQVRKLHSDNTLLSYSYRRIGMGTSLTLPAGFQPDALRRMLHIKLAGTDDHPDVVAIKADYDRIKPQVMGAIFTVIAEVLKHLGKALETTLVGVPEMSDFARRLHAADLAYPNLGLYESYRQHAFEVLIAAGLEDPLALLVLRLMDKQGDEPFRGLPAALLAELRKAAGDGVAEKWFPADATRMGEKLTKLDGPLRRLGIVVARDTRTSRGIPYVITKVKSPDSGAGAAGSGADQGSSTT
jgi:Bifunctional DNA primase/polymerase, N-terminal